MDMSVAPELDNIPPFPDLFPPMVEPNPVYNRIVSVIGVHPNRVELIAIVQGLGWGPLSRSEKRVKAALIQKLESMRDLLLPYLETSQGRRALEASFVSFHREKQPRPLETPSPPERALPPEATIAYYLNH
jgi:hypothetical protein